MFGKKKEEAESKSTLTVKDVTDIVRNALEDAKLKYNYISESNVFVTGFMGDDLPITANIGIRDGILRYVCHLDLKAQTENYKNVAWELNCINKNLMFGMFYLDPDDGMISFEYNFPYAEASLSEGFVLAFLQMAGKTVDKYDGDLKKLAETVKTSHDNSMYS